MFGDDFFRSELACFFPAGPGGDACQWKDVLRSEFEYYYNKDAASFASGYVAPEKYAERFADFKLKVSAAETAGLDTALSFREKVENYRNRLINRI